jgi:acyl dehydratase
MTSTTDDRIETTLAEVSKYADSHLGWTEWTEMTQDTVNQFADITNDHNFIHVDPERAAKSPFKGTIAHGFLTLSLIAPATLKLVVTDASASINYGLDKVRFPAPLPVGARYRVGAEIGEVSDVNGGVQVKVRVTVEVESSERPACVADALLRYLA